MGSRPALQCLQHLEKGGGTLRDKSPFDEAGDGFSAYMERLTKRLILWTSSMILLAGVLGFLAGRFA
jgi:hypothetical protein